MEYIRKFQFTQCLTHDSCILQRKQQKSKWHPLLPTTKEATKKQAAAITAYYKVFCNLKWRKNGNPLCYSQDCFRKKRALVFRKVMVALFLLYPTVSSLALLSEELAPTLWIMCCVVCFNWEKQSILIIHLTLQNIHQTMIDYLSRSPNVGFLPCPYFLNRYFTISPAQNWRKENETEPIFS